MNIVLATGGFDPLHKGHIEYLMAAKELGDYLIVGVNSDEWLRRKKGQAFMSELDRFAIVSALACVDEVVLFDDADGSACDAIETVKSMYPKAEIIFANGGDRTSENIPEQAVYGDEITFVFGVGGDDKANSSSWLLNAWSGRMRRMERERITAILAAERDEWVKPGSFSYRNALNELIGKIND